MYGDNRGGYDNLTAAVHDRRLPFIQKVYGLLLASIGFAVLTGTLVMATPSAGSFPLADGRMISVPMGVVAMKKGSFLIWLLLFGMLFLGRAVAQNPIAGLMLLFGFTGVAGAWIAPNIWYVSVMQGEPRLVGLAGALTTVTFLALTIYTMFSRKDFSFLGAGLFVAGIGLIAACLLNAFFFHSGWGLTILSWGILVFASVGVLFDTHRLLRELPENAYVFATLSLFIDLLNMFLAILSLLSGSRR